MICTPKNFLAVSFFSFVIGGTAIATELPWIIDGSTPEVIISKGDPANSHVLVCFEKSKGGVNDVWVSVNGNLFTKIKKGGCTSIKEAEISMSLPGEPTQNQEAKGTFKVVQKFK